MPMRTLRSGKRAPGIVQELRHLPTSAVARELLIWDRRYPQNENWAARVVNGRPMGKRHVHQFASFFCWVRTVSVAAVSCSVQQLRTHQNPPQMCSILDCTRTVVHLKLLHGMRGSCIVGFIMPSNVLNSDTMSEGMVFAVAPRRQRFFAYHTKKLA